jgi:hypothetical protein
MEPITPQFDTSQMSRGIRPMSPTSGPNAFINGNTGQAMQPMSRDAGKAADTARRESYTTGRAQGLSNAANYAKTLDNTPSAMTFAKPNGAMPVNQMKKLF